MHFRRCVGGPVGGYVLDVIRKWDGFCGPLEVRTHPLPPPDSGASFSSFGVFVFEIWVLRFRPRVLCFWDLGVFVFNLGCFVFEIWVLRASVFVFKCFVFETTVLHGSSTTWFQTSRYCRAKVKFSSARQLHDVWNGPDRALIWKYSQFWEWF